jgi:hypothetical protein
LAIAGLTENQNHHVLILSAAPPTAAELAEAARPVARSRHHPQPRPRSHPSPKPAPKPAVDPEPPKTSNTLRAFSVAFRQLMDEAFGTSSERERTDNAAASVGIPQSSMVGRNPSPPALMAPAPAIREVSTPNNRTISRPYPLPPVGQRGDILRPPKTSTTGAVGQPAHMRALEVSPAMGRQATTPSTSSPRHNS